MVLSTEYVQTLRDEVRELHEKRDRLLAELNEVEHLLSIKHPLLVATRAYETAARDVRSFERR